VPQVTDGRLGDAVVARPGHIDVTGHMRRIPGSAALPPAAGHALGAEQNCQDQDIQPTAGNLAHVSDVVFCLMNAMRQNAGLPDLKQQADLARASVDHSQDMVDNSYFAHDSLDGRTVVTRLTSAKYIPAQGEWVVGENLAWGSGALSTPRSLVNAWMNSPPHRENLLAPDYKEVGMGLVLGTPSKDAPNGVTATTDFGTRIGDAALHVPGSSPSAAAGAASPGSQAGVAKRKAAMRRCARRSGAAKRRCVLAARRIR
jgi:uncharacterized protein YkwD